MLQQGAVVHTIAYSLHTIGTCYFIMTARLELRTLVPVSVAALTQEIIVQQTLHLHQSASSAVLCFLSSHYSHVTYDM